MYSAIIKVPLRGSTPLCCRDQVLGSLVGKRGGKSSLRGELFSVAGQNRTAQKPSREACPATQPHMDDPVPIHTPGMSAMSLQGQCRSQSPYPEAAASVKTGWNMTSPAPAWELDGLGPPTDGRGLACWTMDHEPRAVINRIILLWRSQQH